MFLASKLDEILMYWVWLSSLEIWFSCLLLSSGTGSCVWPCGGPRRHNVTRRGVPQGQGGRVGRMMVIRWGSPPPSYGGVRRRTVFRLSVPQVLWESAPRGCFCDIVVCCFSFVSDYCWIVWWSILPCLWSTYPCLLLGIYYLVLEIYSCLWFPFLYSWSIDSWYSFTWEFVCVHRWDEHFVWLFWDDVGVWVYDVGLMVSLEFVGELVVRLLLYSGSLPLWLGSLPLWLGRWPLWLDLGPCDWTTVPVIGLITPWLGSLPPWLGRFTPVIGLRSPWLGFYPCVPDFWIRTSVCGWVLVWWLVWGLETGVGSSFLGYVLASSLCIFV